MSIHQLSTQNFHIVGNQRQSLNINYGGNVLVFFKLQGCQGCAAFEPIFHQLSNEDRRVSYGILDLTYNRDIVQLSRSTTTPIQKVPHLILYSEGRPYARFKGEKNIQSLKNFISDATPQQTPQKPSFVQPQQQNMYGGPPTRGNVYMPESQPPRQAINMANSGIPAQQAHPSMRQQCEQDNEDCLMIPDQIIPHNMPWESDYKKLTGVI